VFCLAARARFTRLAATTGAVPRHSPPVARAIAWVRENFGKPAGLEACAEAVGISPNRLSRLFVEETGRAFTDFLIDCRIGKAREMLAEPGWSIKEISAACGYPDPNYFSRLFKKVTGVTPSAFASGASGERADVAD
jgi:two-component system response regulator YesN